MASASCCCESSVCDAPNTPDSCANRITERINFVLSSLQRLNKIPSGCLFSCSASGRLSLSRVLQALTAPLTGGFRCSRLRGGLRQQTRFPARRTFVPRMERGLHVEMPVLSGSIRPGSENILLNPSGLENKDSFPKKL